MPQIMHSPNRRALLRGLAVMPAVGVGAGLPGVALAQVAPVSQDFIAVSRQLTGFDTLPAALRVALYNALRAQDAAFEDKLSRLAAALQAGTAVQDAGLAKLSSTILTGWYLGIVGAGDSAVCIAYESDLSNQLVADVLHPPSYAYGAYGSWGAKPV